jgi:phosphatidylglycerophosphatase C
MTVVAAFDVDGTLTTRDCVVPFMCHVRGTAPLLTRLALRAPRLVLPVIRYDRDAVRAVGTRAALAGIHHDQLVADAQTFAAVVAAERMRHDTVARLTWHREHGHPVVLVSASFEVYLEPLAAHLGADAALGTRVEVGPDGVCTGALSGSNCRGAEKVRRLHDWLDEHHGGRAAVEVWAYGDSAGDRELLADADRSHWANGPIGSVSPTGQE